MTAKIRRRAGGEKLDPLEASVREWTVAEGLLRPGDRILAAVSGGADSLALLHVLWSLRTDLDLELAVASLDHGLRGPAGEADLAFVEAVARRLDVPFHGERARPGVLALRRGMSLEDAARRLRYDFLGRVARRWGPGPAGPVRVATGHTATDQAETVLMRIIEGTGLAGLGGIPPFREEDGWVLIRPLLRVSRDEVRRYCRRKGLEPREDLTNSDERFRRNLVRARILPALREYNPKVEEALTHLADLAREEAAALDEETDRQILALARDVVPEGESPFLGLEKGGRRVIALPKEGFARLAGALKPRVIRKVVAALAGEDVLRDVGFEGAVRAARAVAGLPVGGRLNLPGHVVLEAGYRYVFFTVVRGDAGRRVTESGERLANGPVGGRQTHVELRVPGTTEVPELGWAFEVETETERAAADDRAVLDIDRGKVALPLAVRTRRRGDRFFPAGLGADKKLKDFFIAAKVPRAERDRWPLVVDAQDRIVWVTGLRGDERFVAAHPTTGPVLRVKAWRLSS